MLFELRWSCGSMCYQILEVYSDCRCLYYQHAIDKCASHERAGHHVQKRIVEVGYKCHEHSTVVPLPEDVVGDSAGNRTQTSISSLHSSWSKKSSFNIKSTISEDLAQDEGVLGKRRLVALNSSRRDIAKRWKQARRISPLFSEVQSSYFHNSAPSAFSLSQISSSGDVDGQTQTNVSSKAGKGPEDATLSPISIRKSSMASRRRLSDAYRATDAVSISPSVASGPMTIPRRPHVALTDVPPALPPPRFVPTEETGISSLSRSSTSTSLSTLVSGGSAITPLSTSGTAEHARSFPQLGPIFQGHPPNSLPQGLTVLKAVVAGNYICLGCIGVSFRSEVELDWHLEKMHVSTNGTQTNMHSSMNT